MDSQPLDCGAFKGTPVGFAGVTDTACLTGTGEHKFIHPWQRCHEFTRTTALGIERVGGAKKGKAIIILNPAEPPLLMRDTVHCLTEGTPDEAKITESIKAMVAEVQRYVPGYKLKQNPVFDGKRVSVFLEVAGLGDYLPKYAGNLDIMTAAALRTGEMFAQRLQQGTLNFPQVTTEAA